MKLFRRKNEVTLNRIHHTVIVNENGEKLKLVVNADPMRLTAGLTKAQAKLRQAISKETPEMEEIHDAALLFSTVMFGSEQAGKLFEFYAGDSACVINVCSQVFTNQLADKITAAQKRMKV